MDELLQVYGEMKSSFDNLKVHYHFDEDMEVCNYVISQLCDFDISTINYGSVISYDELVSRSMLELRMFGDDIYSKIRGIEKITSIYSEIDNRYGFTTIIGFQVNNSGDILVNTGRVDRYIIPKERYELSIYHLAHEHVHALKETNYSEFQDSLTVGETLPIFFELMIYNPSEILKKELIKFRIKGLLQNKIEYIYYDDLFDNCIEKSVFYNKPIKNKNTDMCYFIRSKLGCYLNSFYYALMLYNMYRVTPDRIMNLVNMVLKHQITTYDMLNYLGLYGDIRGEVFEKELKYIKKLVK